MFTKSLKKALGMGVAMALCATMMFATPLNASAAIDLTPQGKFYTDYASGNDTLAAADELNTLISAEGNVLMKNDGTLPLSYGASVSVFGAAQDSMVGASGSATVTAALKAEGFKVNTALESYYASVGTTAGTENSTFTTKIENSYALYNDAAVIIFRRDGGEGNDLNTVVTGEPEDNKDGDGNDYGWEHKSLGADADKVYKHYLQITESEEKLISYVKAHFKKIVVLLN
ncbi:MAG: glycoside hydrolase family 3 C-terminal domain-containing protein, partial [Clostridia bacterium]|nr:glycoside hydrolase family 3 C-terminal domain-containing protein [Clostridia bacterium]